MFPVTPQVALVVKNPPANAGDTRNWGLILGSERCPGGGHGSPLQYSCLKNLMDRGAWRATVHRVTKSRTTINLAHNVHPCYNMYHYFKFLWLNNIPLSGETTLYLSLHPLVDIWIVSTFWLLWSSGDDSWLRSLPWAGHCSLGSVDSYRTPQSLYGEPFNPHSIPMR